MPEKSLRTNDLIDETIEKYAGMVYRLAFSQTKNKSDADDVFQEVFLKYISTNRTFQSEEHEKAWLIRVTINCSKSLWLSAWRRHTVPLQEEIAFDMPEDDELYHVLLQLPKKYRAVIHLFYYEDMSIAQISEILHEKESTVRTQLTRARAELRNLLKGDCKNV